MIHSHSVALLLALLAGALGAQTQTLVVPAAAAGAEGNSLIPSPWDRGDEPARVQFVYDGENFTAQGVHTPIEISAISFRANGSTTNAAGTYGGVTVRIATATTDYLVPDLTFANNLGGDVQVALAAGTVALQPITQATSPNARLVTIPVQPPFRYDAVLGDLVVDIELPAAMYGGTGAVPCDGVSGQETWATRVFNEDASAVADDVTAEEAAVLEIDYTPVADAASVIAYGSGCIDIGRATFYELFQGPASPEPAGPLPSSLVATPTANGYQITAGGTAWFTPTSAPLPIGDDQIIPFPLPWAFVHPGGSTSEVRLCSNGFLWLDDESTVPEFDPQSFEFVRDGPRLAGAWQDLAPNVGGSVHFDVDPGGAAVYATWIDVPEYRRTNANTFQIALFQNGGFELRFRAIDLQTGDMIIGYTPGANAVDPGSRDLSAAVPFATGPDTKALQLVPGTRPILGSVQDLWVRRVPLPSGLVALTLGFVRRDPGLDLASLGAPGCLQLHSLDDTLGFAFAVQGTALVPLTIPASPSVQGIRAFVQAAAFAPGLNPLGVVTSGGLELVLDIR